MSRSTQLDFHFFTHGVVTLGGVRLRVVVVVAVVVVAST